MFTKARAKISGGIFVNYNAKASKTVTVQSGIELLRKNIAPGALHNSAERYDPPKCHEHTRQAVLQKITDWIENMDRQARFLWLYGPAGAGKSAIEQTIAELCYQANFLAASFFFSRDSAGRNEKTFLITTIVDQLILSIPEISEHVGNALYNNPSLLLSSLEAQMDALIVKPLEAVVKSGSKSGADFMNARPKVIILDGLDECGDPESQRYILKVLMNSVSNNSIPFSFILASRPEQHIREAFDENLLNSLTTRLVLDDKYRPNDDIRRYLRSKFQYIKHRHPSRAHLPTSWPSDKEVERLVQKSSGQFIYASTVVKFIGSHRHLPTDRLNIIFGVSPRGDTTPFAEMDSLYHHILASAQDSAPHNIETALNIFTVILFLHGRNLRLTPHFVAGFLSLREGEVFTVLSDLHSIIEVPSVGKQEPLRFSHASLGDFLTDQSRSGGTFFLDYGVSHRNIANMIMKKLMNLPSALTPQEKEEKEALQAVFPEHCLKATPDANFVSNLYEFNMILCPHRPWTTRTSHVTQIFTEMLDPINAGSRVPELLIWMQGQYHPDWNEDLFTHHLSSIDTWLATELSAIKIQDHYRLNRRHILTSATLVDFPQFRDIHHLIPRVLDLRSKHTTERYHGQIEDAGNWKIYLNYRQIVSEFLTDRARSGKLFVGQECYLGLAKYLFDFLSDHLEKIENYEADIPKTALLLLPVIFSKTNASDRLEEVLNTYPFAPGPQLRNRFPEENWEELFSSSYQACRLALEGGDWVSVVAPDHADGVGTSSRNSMLMRVKWLFRSYKS